MSRCNKTLHHKTTSSHVDLNALSKYELVRTSYEIYYISPVARNSGEKPAVADR